MKLYIPQNLDLDSLIYETPAPFRNFKRDKLRYIIHLISAIPLMKKDLIHEDYIPIHAKTLQRKIHNYREYLQYLIDDLKILECNNHYVVGGFSMGYRLVKKYRESKVAPVKVMDYTFRKTLQRQRVLKDATVMSVPHITKWFEEEKLQIDLPLVKQFLNRELELKMGNQSLWNLDRNEKKKNPVSQYNHALMSAERLDWKDYHLMLDDNVYRFHSNLTNMRSIVRNAVSYDGQKLISIDIRNSQPYLSTVLFNEAFWSGSENQKTIKNVAQNDPFSLLNGIITINNTNIPVSDSYIMVVDIVSFLTGKDFIKYVKLVSDGSIYDFLQDKFHHDLGIDYCSRRDVKAAIFQVLFTDNRFIGQKEAEPKFLFKQLFPDVYKLFALIKKRDKTLLPRLLQSIESHLIIDVIAKRISEELPSAPIFTIHDSIATTEDNVDKVRSIMSEELFKAIGHRPVLQVEQWDRQNIFDYLSMLERKAKDAA